MAGLAAARAQGRNGGQPSKLTADQVRADRRSAGSQPDDPRSQGPAGDPPESVSPHGEPVAVQHAPGQVLVEHGVDRGLVGGTNAIVQPVRIWQSDSCAKRPAATAPPARR